MSKPPKHENEHAKPLYSSGSVKTSKPKPEPVTIATASSKRKPPTEIVYIPQATSPSEWTRKDKNAVAGAVALGIVVAAFALTFIFILLIIALTGLTDFAFWNQYS